MCFYFICKRYTTFTSFLFGIPHLDKIFWIAVVARILVDTCAFTLYVKGIQLSPLSLTIPMISLTPLFLIITSFLINHLLPNFLGVAGVFTIVFGIYFLNFDHDTKHILSPFFSIWREKGVLYVTLAAILFSVVVSLQKLAIDHSNPYFYTAFFQLLWATCLTPVVYIVNRQGFLKLFRPKMMKELFPAGAFDAVQNFAENLALLFGLPVYVKAVGNTNILFSSIFGWIFFKEKIHKHVIPTIIIVIGIILITFAQK